MDDNENGVQPTPELDGQEQSVVDNGQETEAVKTDEQEPAKQERPNKGFIPQHVAQKRFDQLTKKNYELQRELESLRSQGTSNSEQQHGNQNSYSRDDVLREAENLVNAKQFNDRCDSIYKDGVGEFSDFNEALQNLGSIGGLPNDRLQVIAELPNAHEVIYELGNDLELADKIFSMPVHKQAIELAKLSVAKEKAKSEPKPKPQVSKAPEPIDPIGKGEKNAVPHHKMSMDEWAALREKQRKERGLSW